MNWEKKTEDSVVRERVRIKAACERLSEALEVWRGIFPDKGVLHNEG